MRRASSAWRKWPNQWPHREAAEDLGRDVCSQVEKGRVPRATVWVVNVSVYWAFGLENLSGTHCMPRSVINFIDGEVCASVKEGLPESWNHLCYLGALTTWEEPKHWEVLQQLLWIAMACWQFDHLLGHCQEMTGIDGLRAVRLGPQGLSPALAWCHKAPSCPHFCNHRVFESPRLAFLPQYFFPLSFYYLCLSMFSTFSSS